MNNCELIIFISHITQIVAVTRFLLLLKSTLKSVPNIPSEKRINLHARQSTHNYPYMQEKISSIFESVSLK